MKFGEIPPMEFLSGSLASLSMYVICVELKFIDFPSIFVVVNSVRFEIPERRRSASVRGEFVSDVMMVFGGS
jgi:hypothetical protein